MRRNDIITLVLWLTKSFNENQQRMALLRFNESDKQQTIPFIKRKQNILSEAILDQLKIEEDIESI